MSAERKRQLVCEPITRPDGISIWVWSSSDTIDFETQKAIATYTKAEVALFGEGELDEGINRIGQHFYKTPANNLFLHAPKPLAREMEELKRRFGLIT